MKNSVKLVPGIGPTNANLMVIAEAPGEQEDRLGKPLIGKSGQLFNKMLEYINVKREEIYITNVVKVRPDSNRTPTDEELESWRPILTDEIYKVNPKIILTLGSCAARTLLGYEKKLTEIRGQQFIMPYRLMIAKVIPTWHPAYLLRNPSKKDEAKQDLLKVKELLNGI
jgi:uracil-DNA glycosylase